MNCNYPFKILKLTSYQVVNGNQRSHGLQLLNLLECAFLLVWLLMYSKIIAVKNVSFSFFILFISTLTLVSCVSHPPPSNIDNVCSIFRQYPKWYKAAKDVEHRWKVPVPVQMAIIHQESKFDASARPPRGKLLKVIPWKRPSTAYGYAQALHSTWNEYKVDNGGFLSSRGDFTDGVDFIGWYANQANIKAHIPRSNAYELYLAYHEGVGGYLRKTYLKKPWLLGVARKVSAKSQMYAMQLNSCKR